MNAIPNCAGKWRLFDSTDPRDHYEAQALCATCPFVTECRATLARARAEAHVPAKYGPAGTWAGQLVGPGHRIAASRLRAEEEMFTPAELRTFHADFNAGFRSPRTIMAERIYQRIKKRGQQSRMSAA